MAVIRAEAWRGLRGGPGVRLTPAPTVRCHGSRCPVEGASVPLSRRACREPRTQLAGPERHLWACKAPEGGCVDVGLMPFSDSEGRASVYKPHMFRASWPCWKSRHEYKALTLFFSSNIKKMKNLPTYKSVFQVTKEKGNRTPCFIFCGFLNLVFFVKKENRKEKKPEEHLILLTESIVIVDCVYSFYL